MRVEVIVMHGVCSSRELDEAGRTLKSYLVSKYPTVMESHFDYEVLPGRLAIKNPDYKMIEWAYGVLKDMPELSDFDIVITNGETDKAHQEMSVDESIETMNSMWAEADKGRKRHRLF